MWTVLLSWPDGNLYELRCLTLVTLRTRVELLDKLVEISSGVTFDCGADNGIQDSFIWNWRLHSFLQLTNWFAA